MKFAYVAIFIVASFAHVSFAKQIQFTDCGTREIKSVDVSPCESEPCTFKRGQKVTVTAVGTSSKNADSGELQVTVKLGGVDVDFPGVDTDLCHTVQCPIKKGQEYTLKWEIEVEDYFPDLTTDMKWLGIGNGNVGTLFCASVRIAVNGDL